MMKIMIVGDWKWEIYEKSLGAALEGLGHTVKKFSISGYFNGLVGRFQNAIPVPGPAMAMMNYMLMKAAKREMPDLMLAWRCTHLLPNTIDNINKLGVATISYNNDDPFSADKENNAAWHYRKLWYWYKKCLKHYQYNLFYRKINVDEAIQFGAAHADLFMPYFIPWIHRPVELHDRDENRFCADVVFVGHYENDNRMQFIRDLVKAGLSVKIFGGSWNKEKLGSLYEYFYPIAQVNGEDYTKALCGAKICLAFMSKLNRDTYTRRCFEIPACGKVMLAERTDDLANMYKEDEEACFFANSRELLAKARKLKEDAKLREKIGRAGYSRVWHDGNDIRSRAMQLVKIVHG